MRVFSYSAANEGAYLSFQHQKPMNLLDLIDRIMHTTPALPPASPVRVSAEHDVWVAHAQVERMQRDIHSLDIAVRVAEARLRARGVQLPDDKRP